MEGFEWIKIWDRRIENFLKYQLIVQTRGEYSQTKVSEIVIDVTTNNLQ